MSKMKTFLATIVGAGIFLVSTPCLQASQQCLSAKEFYKRLQDNVKINSQLRKYIDSFSPEGKSFRIDNHLCGVVYKSKKPPYDLLILSYTPEGKVFDGLPYDLKSQKKISLSDKNINLAQFLSISQKQKNDLLAHSFEIVGPSSGKPEHIVYFVGSPDCPYCQKMAFLLMKIVYTKEFRKADNISIRYIPYAPKSSAEISKIACLLKDKKLFLVNYAGKRCSLEKGEKVSGKIQEKIKSAIDYAQSNLAIQGVPILFNENGQLVSKGFEPEKVYLYFLQTLNLLKDDRK